MTRSRFWPRSLSGQMALLIAIALFVAQAINFGMLLQGRRQLRFQQLIGPTVERMVDANERLAAGPLKPGEKLRGVRIMPTRPKAALSHDLPDVEAALSTALSEAGVHPVAIGTKLRAVRPDDRRLKRLSPRRAGRLRRFGGEAVVAIELAGRGWLQSSGPWQRSELPLFWTLLGQTLILYIIVLVPVLWVGRRISRPLRTLATAARDFRPGEAGAPIEESGPQDVRAVITAFNALRLRVTAMLDEKDRMLGAIGHDLRTPLAALRVRIESVEDDTDRTKMAETIAEMNGTLDDILSLARLGRPSEMLTEVDLAALVDAVVEDFRDLEAPVSFDEETPRLQMRLRPSLMRRAVRNLIENAVKYGKRADVRIAGEPKEVRIIVSDQGPGIPPDRLADVFDPFTRLETSRNKETGGIGLGLALAHAIVRDAGGAISLVNRAEGGLDATIILPR